MADIVDGILARAQAYDPSAFAALNAPADAGGQTATDYGVQLRKALDRTGAAMGYGLQKLGLDSFGGSIRDFYRDREVTAPEQSQAFQTQESMPWTDAIQHPSVAAGKVLADALSAAPDMALATAGGGMMGGLAKLAGVGGTAATVAAGAGGGAGFALPAAERADREIQDMADDQLAATPVFQDAYAQTDPNLTDDMRFKQARDLVADRVAGSAAGANIAVGAAMGPLGEALGAGAQKVMPKKLGQVASGAAEGGLFMGGQTMAENANRKRQVDPSASLFEHVPDAMVGGAVFGGAHALFKGRPEELSAQAQPARQGPTGTATLSEQLARQSADMEKPQPTTTIIPPAERPDVAIPGMEQPPAESAQGIPGDSAALLAAMRGARGDQASREQAMPKGFRGPFATPEEGVQMQQAAPMLEPRQGQDMASGAASGMDWMQEPIPGQDLSHLEQLDAEAAKREQAQIDPGVPASNANQSRINALGKRIDALTAQLAEKKTPAERTRIEDLRTRYEVELRGLTGETAPVLTPEEQARADGIRNPAALPPGMGFERVGDPADYTQAEGRSLENAAIPTDHGEGSPEGQMPAKDARAFDNGQDLSEEEIVRRYQEQAQRQAAQEYGAKPLSQLWNFLRGRLDAKSISDTFGPEVLNALRSKAPRDLFNSRREVTDADRKAGRTTSGQAWDYLEDEAKRAGLVPPDGNLLDSLMSNVTNKEQAQRDRMNPPQTGGAGFSLEPPQDKRAFLKEVMAKPLGEIQNMAWKDGVEVRRGQGKAALAEAIWQARPSLDYETVQAQGEVLGDPLRGAQDRAGVATAYNVAAAESAVGVPFQKTETYARVKSAVDTKDAKSLWGLLRHTDNVNSRAAFFELTGIDPSVGKTQKGLKAAIDQFAQTKENETTLPGDVKPGEARGAEISTTEPQATEITATEAAPMPRSKSDVDLEPEKFGLTLGEKIGGSRKDTATQTGPRVRIPGRDETTPAWRKPLQAVQVKEANLKTGEDRTYWSIADQKGRIPTGKYKFDTKEDAEAAIPLAAVAVKHRIGKRGDAWEIYRRVTDRKTVVIKDGFETEEAAKRYMVEHAEEILNTKTGFGEEILARPEKVYREGEPRREGPAKGQDFLDAYGFRGVEFGEWNDQGERQEVLNHAYDGLGDLAAVLDVPPKALSLNGDLALAFGARGRGLSSAKAHYERDYGVINLTKLTGAGSLAHEWFHALDHYLARQDTKASSEKVRNARGDTVFKTGKSAGRDFLSHGTSYKSQVREELRKAYENLLHDIAYKAEQYKEDTEKAERFVGRARGYLEKGLNDIRANLARETQWGRKRAPATPEQLDRFDALAAQLLSGDNLTLEMRNNDADGKRRSRFGSYRNSNDVLDGLAAIYKEVRGRSGFNAEKTGPFNNLAASVRDFAIRAKMLDDARTQTEKTKQVPTDYRREAYLMDRGRASDYWGEPHELAARAFSSYVEDRIKGGSGRSDFLVYGANNERPEYKLFSVRPYPEGAEREAINAAFDKFFKTVKTKETDKGVAMYRKGDEGQPASVSASDLRAKLSGTPFENVIIHDSPEDLQNQALRRYMERTGNLGAKGVFTDRPTVFAGNHETIEDAIKSVIHEAGHDGLEALRQRTRSMGDEVRGGAQHVGNTLDAIYAANNRGIREWLSNDKEGQGYKDIDLRSAQGRRDVTEEWLMHTSLGDLASPSQARWYDKYVAAMARWLRAVSDKIGVKIGWTDAETRDFLRQAFEARHSADEAKMLGGGGHMAMAAPAMRQEAQPDAMLRKAVPTAKRAIEEKDEILKGVPIEANTKNDISTLRRFVSLPHWIAKDYPTFAKLYDRQMRRRDDRTTKVTDAIGTAESFMDLTGDDLAKAQDIIWQIDGKKIEGVGDWARADGKLDNGRTKLVLNDEHYAALEQHLRDAFGSNEAVAKGIADVRRALDAGYIDLYNRFAGMSDADAGEVEKLRASFGKIHNYFPHSRQGDFYIRATSPSEKDELGRPKTLHREHFNILGGSIDVKRKIGSARVAAEAKKRIAALREQYPDAKWEYGAVENLPEAVYSYPIPVEAIQQVLKAGVDQLPETGADGQPLRADVEKALNKSMADVFKARGFGQHLIQRQNVPGFETGDIKRTFYDHMNGLYGFLTKMEAAKDFTQIMHEFEAKKEPKLYDYALNYMRDMLGNQTKVDRTVSLLKSIGYVKYLGGRISTAAINLTQNVISGVPTLSMHSKRAGRNFVSALTDLTDLAKYSWSGKTDNLRRITPDEADMLHTLYAAGDTRAQFLEQMRLQVADSPATKAWGRVMDVLGLPMELTERFNRASLALAAYRAARAGDVTNAKTLQQFHVQSGQKFGHDNAIEFARMVTNDAHFVYGRSNMPEVFRGSDAGKWASSAYQFRTFSHNMMSLWAHMVKSGPEGRKALLRSMAGLVALGGLAAAPGYRSLMATFTGQTGDDLERKLRKAVGGGLMGDLLIYGMPAASGVHLSGSLGMDLPVSSEMASKGGNPIWAILGIPGSFAQETGQMLGAIKSGNMGRAVALSPATPSVVRNVANAMRLHDEGAYTQSGKPIPRLGERGPMTLTTAETIAKMLGFSPVELTNQYTAADTIQAQNQFRLDAQKGFADRYANAMRRRDMDEVRAIRRQVREWNAQALKDKKRGMVIDLSSALKARARPLAPAKRMRREVKEDRAVY